MASFITAGNATNGLQVSSDNTGILELRTGTGSGTTAVTLSTGQNATFAGTITVANGITGDLKFNSGYGSVATAYGCRAWVNFNGTGTVAIRASGNVSSITDGGTGVYTVNITTALTDANYSVVGYAGGTTGVVSSGIRPTSNRSTTAISIGTYDNALVLADAADINVAIFR